MPIDLKYLLVANAKLQIFGDLPKGLSPFLSAQLISLSDTNINFYFKFVISNYLFCSRSARPPSSLALRWLLIPYRAACPFVL